MPAGSPAFSLVVIGNSPGEVAGWAIPVASEARRVSVTEGRRAEISLCLPPCQFASGQEHAAASASGVFDHILNPADVFRLALGLRGWSPHGPTSILHVGGEFWYTHRLARWWRAPAFALVERAHIAKHHRWFTRIFVITAALRDRLASRGVPIEKLVVAGDPRHDALALPAASSQINGNGASPVVAFMPGSRDSVFSAMFPFWVDTAVALRRELPGARLVTVISQFISPEVRRAVVVRHREQLAAAGVDVTDKEWPAVRASDLVLTVPGTNTLELAVLRVPSLVVLPLGLRARVPAEGPLEWFLRIPILGDALRLRLARRVLRSLPHVALPNMQAGRRIMPELVGDVTPEQVAGESARLLRDPAARGAMAKALEAIPFNPGASRRILDGMHLTGAVA